MKPCKITVDLYNTFRERMPEYVQYDRNVPLEITVLENGKPARLDGLFGRLLASKPDGHEIYSNDVEMNGNVITTVLGEQIFTASGIVKVTVDILDEQNSKRALVPFEIRVRSAVITDESIKSSSDYQTITALISDVRALDTMFQEGQDIIYEAKEIVGTLTDLNAIASESEEKRQADELNRVSKELIRVAEEEQRVTNEEQRVANEETRITNEEQRVASEQDRVTNETNRRIAENTRIAQERARQDAELQRNTIFEENEDLRKEGEKERVANENKRKADFDSWEVRETVRLKSEENRIIQEGERVENETQRQQQEETRQQQEETRQQTYTAFNDAEASRVASEQQRQLAEEKRKTAEAERQANYVNRENTRDQQYAMAEQTRDNAFTQNEANRQLEYTQAERERVESEELRKSRERERETAESQRATTERERVNAEQKRAADFNREIENIQNTMNQAVSNVNGAIDTANSTMESIEQRAEACLPVIEQSSKEIERARVDYIGNQHSSIKKANDANVDWLLGEVNTAHYEGQHITALDTLEGQSKSAILKGQTLVNYFPEIIPTEGFDLQTDSQSQKILNYNPTLPFEEGQTYTVYIWLKNVVSNNSSRLTIRIANVDYAITPFNEGLNIMEITISGINGSNYNIRIPNDYLAKGDKATVKDVVIIKNNTELDIVPFYGMQSVKMPVLTTTGKNLLNNNSLIKGKTVGDTTVGLNINNLSTNPRRSIFSESVKLDIGEKYFLKSFNSDYQIFTPLHDENGIITQGSSWKNEYVRFIAISQYMRIIVKRVDDNEITDEDILKIKNSIMVCKSDDVEEYEPFKSNILTVNEDVTLRGVGDVKDTLDCLTGQVTKRIGEIVLDGSQRRKPEYNGVFDNVYRIGIEHSGGMETANTKSVGYCDKLVSIYDWTGDYEHCYVGKSVVVLFIDKKKIGELTDEQVSTYLQSNPITIQYLLATESVKTVDLSDNHVYSYKGTTHYDCSSAEGSLVPTLSIDVPTNLPAVVTRQRATIQELEKENVALKTAVTIVDEHREEGDLELLSSDFDFELRLMEIEFAVGIPMMANYKGVRNMARTPYDMAKALILGGKYEREEMMTKLDRFEKLGSITADQKAELVALMDAVELTQ